MTSDDDQQRKRGASWSQFFVDLLGWVGLPCFRSLCIVRGVSNWNSVLDTNSSQLSSSVSVLNGQTNRRLLLLDD